MLLLTGRSNAAAASGAASGSPSGFSGGTSAPGIEADTATQRNPSPDTTVAQTPRLPSTALATGLDASDPAQPPSHHHHHHQQQQQAQHQEQLQQQQTSRGGQVTADGTDDTGLQAAAGHAEGDQAVPAVSGFSASQMLDTPAGSEPYTPVGTVPFGHGPRLSNTSTHNAPSTRHRHACSLASMSVLML